MVSHILSMSGILIIFLTISQAEQGSNIDLGDPDSGELMSVDVKVIDPVAGEPPKLRLVKEGESTEYCITFESIFEATSYDINKGDYDEVGGSQIALNSESNDCTLSAQDSNTANITCSVGGTLRFTIDSEVQIDFSGVETGAKYSMSLRDYTWKSSDPSAKLVMVHSFETCSYSRRRLETGAIILEDDSSDDSQEVDYGHSAFDIHGKALDKCASYSSIVERSLVKQSNKIHIVFDHFQCTLSMDPFFGLENEEYGVFETTEAGEIKEVGSMGMVYVAILICVIAFFFFIAVSLNYLPPGTCNCIEIKPYEEKPKEKKESDEKKEEDDIEKQLETGSAKEEETKGNDAEEEAKEDNDDADNEKKEEVEQETLVKNTGDPATDKQSDDIPAQDKKEEDEVVEKKENEDMNDAAEVAQVIEPQDEDLDDKKTQPVDVIEPEDDDEPIPNDDGGDESVPNDDELAANEEDDDINDKKAQAAEIIEPEDDDEPIPNADGDAEPVANEEEEDKEAENVEDDKDEDKTTTDVTVKASAAKLNSAADPGVGTPVKVTLERAWEAGAPEDSSEDSEEEDGDVMGDLNSVKIAIDARKVLNPIVELETPQSTAL